MRPPVNITYDSHCPRQQRTVSSAALHVMALVTSRWRSLESLYSASSTSTKGRPLYFSRTACASAAVTAASAAVSLASDSPSAALGEPSCACAAAAAAASAAASASALLRCRKRTKTRLSRGASFLSAMSVFLLQGTWVASRGHEGLGDSGGWWVGAQAPPATPAHLVERLVLDQVRCRHGFEFEVARRVGGYKQLDHVAARIEELRPRPQNRSW